VRAKTRRVEIDGKEEHGIVAGLNVEGDQILLAASLTMKPGEYSVKLSAFSESGEERMAALDVWLEPMQAVPLAAMQPPVILLNGFQLSCPIPVTSPPSAETFGNLESELNSAGISVYFFDNCKQGSGDESIEVLAADLGQVISTLRYTDGTTVQQVNIVAHSMGGLIARAYLAGLQSSGRLQPPANPKVRKLVLIATPNFGSFQAFNIGVQSSEMYPGSAFLWNLGRWNQYGDDLRGVDALAIAGDAICCNLLVVLAPYGANSGDGLVSLSSASIGFASDQSRTRILKYCHTDSVPGCSGFGIANVKEAPETGQIILSFLGGTSDWMSIGGTPTTDPYLSKYGGVYFAAETAGNQYLNDLSSVSLWTISLSNGGATNSVYYAEFVSGTGTFQAKSASLGQVTYGPITVPTGRYTAFRAKLSPAIFGVTPLLANASGWVVQSDGTITITGVGFGAQQCGGCRVTASNPQSTVLQISSWTDTSIRAFLPVSFVGIATISVTTASGSDAINIMASLVSSIAVAPTSLQFAYTMGGTAPTAQSVQVTNSGGGTLTWSASASASWITLSSAPGALTVSVNTANLSVGLYSGTITISAPGASNSPVSISVTLTVTPAPASLAVSPQALMFSYTVGGAVPAAQGVSITNTGGGTLSWSASASAAWVGLSPASGAASATLSVSVKPATLAAGYHSATVLITAAGASGSPASVSVTLVVQAPQPTVNITSAANGASFQAGFASATWVSIFGTNLAQTTRLWQGSDFVNGLLPTSLSGVSVTINGLAAYVGYISPTQVNALAPDDEIGGAVQVQVTTAQGKSNSLTAQKQQFAPAFFWMQGGTYVAAQHADYTYVGKPGLIAGVATQPAKPGETILLYGTGFGPTSPPLPSAQLVTTPAVLANSVQVTIGGVDAPVAYAGLVEAGLYQFNVTVPSVPSGDAAVVARTGGVQTQTGVSITIQ
jgi:uncharacterized protein (TIGR03437 family)